MVKRAEAVICPINCNSHRACLCVKKLCKELNKPCVLMRNSGLGSLKRTLLELPALMDNSENRLG
jgi:dethiobiotin synthetase